MNHKQPAIYILAKLDSRLRGNDKQEAKINKMVYNLYNLTVGEIRIIEGKKE